VSLPHTLVVQLQTTLLGVSLDGPIWVSIIVLQQPCTVRALLKCCYLKTANRSTVKVSRYMARFWQHSDRKALWFTIFSPVRAPWCNIRYHFHLQQHLRRNLVCPYLTAWKTVICEKVPVRFPPRADILLFFMSFETTAVRKAKYPVVAGLFPWVYGGQGVKLNIRLNIVSNKALYLHSSISSLCGACLHTGSRNCATPML
jgi:hypothetical protein